MVIKTDIISDIKQLNLTFDTLDLRINTPLSVALCTNRDWLIHWLTHYPAHQDKIWVCCHYHAEQLIAVYPLYLKKVTFGYELRFIGTGEPEHAEVCSEFQDFMVDPAYLQQSLALFTEQVKQLKHCRSICFENVLPESVCYQWLRSYKAFGWRYRQQVVGKRYLIAVADDDLSQISQLTQATLRRHARRFVERSDITVYYCEKKQDIPVFFESLINLHNAHWQQRGKTGAFSSKLFYQFHQQFAASMLAQNKLLMFKLKLNDRVIAVFYGFIHQDTLYYYQSGITTASPLPNIGIGMHLIAMRAARALKCKHYDLMKGSAESYKQQYVNGTTAIYSCSVRGLWYELLHPLQKLFCKKPQNNN